METNNNLNFIERAEDSAGAMSKTFMSSVFSWMFLALTVTATVAYYFMSDDILKSYFLNDTGRLNILGYIVMFAPLGFVFLMSLGFNKLSYQVLLGLFIAYSALNGISFGFIVDQYTGSSVVNAFVATAGMFGLMAVVGYTTKTDLTKFGSIMMMGVIGLIIATVVNWFMQSAMMDYIISCIGVLVFTGLTAYDVQKLKRIGAGVEFGTEQTSKLVVMGALSLYLDFINLFLFLLRLMGGRK